ncbi:hypothetical protein GCM10007916_06770 [Psychromonas marina]|uniref:GNAT family N-acetyltransferase n=1 Tax=Psychromonas marina TaxID=88364 RepID=A0ABQ6DXA9_9GAMM|nr:GNAT family N-acetyltransferase [Psychromonas marina]GLS89610.1 hypothetical protein GCM10007916_06770 [Psychromonas marina]
MPEFIKATIDNIDEIATIHKNAFSKSHFTSFFSLSLLEKYYEFFLEGDSETWLQKNDEGEILGFVVFGENLGNTIKEFKSQYKTEIIKTAVLNPAASISKVLSNVYYRFLSKNDSFDETKSLILSIAVNGKGKGTGSKLLSFVSEYNTKKNLNEVGLYVRADSAYAVNFYLKNEYKIQAYTSGLYYMERVNLSKVE